MMKMKRDVNNNSNGGSNGDTPSSTTGAAGGGGGGRSFNDPFPRRSSSFSANPNPNQPSSAYLVYLLLVSVTCIVLIPYAGKITGGLGGIFRRVDEDDSDPPFAGAKTSNYNYNGNGNGNGRKTNKQFKGISSTIRSRSRSRSKSSSSNSDGHYTLLYEDGGAYDGLRGAYEAKCESLEVLVMDTQRVVHGERERTLFLENEIRVLQISENFLKGRVEYLEMMSRRRDSGINSKPPSSSMDPSSFSSPSSMDPSSSSSPSSTYNVFRNPSPSPSPPPPASSPSSSFTTSTASSNGFTSRSDSLIQDLLRMVMVERDRTSALESEIRLLQSSESLMQARIQKLEEKLGTCKA